MTCKEVREHIYLADQQEPLKSALEEHLRSCPECGALYRSLREAEEAATFWEQPEPTTVELIMTALSEKPGASHSGLSSLMIWLLGGLTLLGAGVLVRYSLTFHYLVESHLGSLIDLGVTIALGTFLVSYLAAFILANADRLGEFLLREDKKKAGH